jgi:hypothetical protein
MWDITFLIICFELSMGFVSGLGLFGHIYFPQAQESANAPYGGMLSGNVSATGELIDSSKQPNVDSFSVGAAMLWSGVGLFLNIAGAVAYFLPHLINTFMLPMVLAVPIQALIYLCYSWSLAQFLSGRSGGYYQ